jgi:hypothetical protein
VKIEESPMGWWSCAGFALLLALGCAQTKELGRKAAWEFVPVGSRDVTVTQVQVHGPYLLAAMRGEAGDVDFLAPATEACARLLKAEAGLTYSKQGNFGRFSGEGEVCDPVGIASLAVWRDRRPRARGRPLPLGTARFAVVHRDEELVLLRGRFPFTGRVGIPGGHDIVAVLPNSEICQRPIERGEASIEFRDAGEVPFRLLAGRGFCPILGFAAPVASAAR